jgi:hypothetical protein
VVEQLRILPGYRFESIKMHKVLFYLLYLGYAITPGSPRILPFRFR